MAKPIAIGLFVIVTMIGVLTMFFGFDMLAITLSGPAEALIAVMELSFRALPLMLLLLLASLGVLAIKSLPLWVRALPILFAFLGLVAESAALNNVFRAKNRHKQEYMDSKLVYTSGLHEAIERGDTSRVKAILDSNPGSIPKLLHDGDYERKQPLHIAIQRRDRPTVELLLSYKIQDDFYGDIINSCPRDDQTPLHYAVIAGDAEIVELLLHRGAAINAEDNQQKTALAYAQESGNKEIIKLLVEHGGAMVDYENQAIKAIRKHDRKHVEELIRQKSVEPKANHSLLLRIAAKEGDVEIAKLLLDKGAEINPTNGVGLDTALHEAANFGQVEMIRFLITKGANPNAKNKWNIEPLGWAVAQGKTEAVKVLLELGANPNTPALTAGQSCLHVAKQGQHADIVNILRQHGAREEKKGDKPNSSTQ